MADNRYKRNSNDEPQFDQETPEEKYKKYSKFKNDFLTLLEKYSNFESFIGDSSNAELNLTTENLMAFINDVHILITGKDFSREQTRNVVQYAIEGNDYLSPPNPDSFLLKGLIAALSKMAELNKKGLATYLFFLINYAHRGSDGNGRLSRIIYVLIARGEVIDSQIFSNRPRHVHDFFTQFIMSHLELEDPNFYDNLLDKIMSKSLDKNFQDRFYDLFFTPPVNEEELDKGRLEMIERRKVKRNS